MKINQSYHCFVLWCRYAFGEPCREGTGYIRLSQHGDHKSNALLAYRAYAVP